jgi:hypothetical protein
MGKWIEIVCAHVALVSSREMPEQQPEGKPARHTPDGVELAPADQEQGGFGRAPVEPGIEQALVGREDDHQREGDPQTQQQPPDEHCRPTFLSPGRYRCKEAQCRAASEACMIAARR